MEILLDLGYDLVFYRLLDLQSLGEYVTYLLYIFISGLSQVLYNALVLVLGNPQNDLVIDFGWEAALDVHEGLEEHLLLHEFKLLLPMVFLKELHLLKSVEALSCLEVYLSAQSNKQVVKGTHLLRGLQMSDARPASGLNRLRYVGREVLHI